MSKNLGLLQNGSGKIGNVVLQRNNVQRVRKRQINNPRSQAQQISRMIAATATRTYSALKGIVDHSFQGIAYGGKSMNYFLKNAMRDLRNYAAQWQDGQPENEGFGYSPKYRYGAVPGEFLVSKGTLPSVGKFNAITVQGDSHAAGIAFNGSDPTSKPTPAILAAAGVQKGDQITFLCIDVSELDTTQTPVVRVARIILTDSFDATAADFTAGMFDAKSTPSAVAAFMTPLEEGDFFGGQVFGIEDPADLKTITGAIILSRPIDNTWGRSNERLKWVGDLDDWSEWGDYLYNNALATWMEEGVTVGENDRYLNEGV